MYHRLELRSWLPTNRCYQRQIINSSRQRRVLTLSGADTQRGSVSVAVVARPRQMDSDNPPTAGKCGLLEYDTLNVKYFSCTAIQFPARSSLRTSHT